MDYSTIYMAGIVGFMAFAAWRTPDNELRPTFVLALLWPVILPYILLAVVLDKFGVIFDFEQSKKIFGARKSPNPKVKGFAFTVLFLEFRFFKELKA